MQFAVQRTLELVGQLKPTLGVLLTVTAGIVGDLLEHGELLIGQVLSEDLIQLRSRADLIYNLRDSQLWVKTVGGRVLAEVGLGSCGIHLSLYQLSLLGLVVPNLLDAHGFRRDVELARRQLKLVERLR